MDACPLGLPRPSWHAAGRSKPARRPPPVKSPADSHRERAPCSGRPTRWAPRPQPLNRDESLSARRYVRGTVPDAWRDFAAPGPSAGTGPRPLAATLPGPDSSTPCRSTGGHGRTAGRSPRARRRARKKTAARRAPPRVSALPARWLASGHRKRLAISHHSCDNGRAQGALRVSLRGRGRSPVLQDMWGSGLFFSGGRCPPYSGLTLRARNP